MIYYQRENSTGAYNRSQLIYENFQFIPHVHRDFECVLVLEGELSMTVETERCLLREGDLALVLSNQVHSYETPKHSRAWVWVFAESYVPEFAKALRGKTAPLLPFRLSEERLRFLTSQFLAGHSPSEVPQEVSCSRMEFISALYLICDAYLRVAPLTDAVSDRADLLHRILDYVMQHYTEDISLVTMAKQLGFDRSYLSRSFHRYFGRNFRQFVNEYRINYAKQLLEHTDKNVTEIAYEAGFQSVRTFNRVFRLLDGGTPCHPQSSALELPEKSKREKNRDELVGAEDSFKEDSREILTNQ
jgi:AraC-like DNA-binding protein